MQHFPAEFKQVLFSHLKQSFKSGGQNNFFTDRDLEYFSKGAGRLSTLFTEEREHLAKNYLNDPVLRSGYLLYFLPVNFLKIVNILAEIPLQEVTGGRVRVLDLGSGPGTSALGVLYFYHCLLKSKAVKDAWLDLNLVDQNFKILKDAQALHHAFSRELMRVTPTLQSQCAVRSYDFVRGGLNRFLRGVRFHLILLSNVLTEFASRAEKMQFVSSLVENHLEKNGGKIVLIEPGTKKDARDLQALRDELVLHKKQVRVLAPCLHQEKCPLNVVNKRDWCHFYFDWDTPDFIKKVDRLIGNQKDWLNCSYLVLGNEKTSPAIGRDQWRVISNLMWTKGKGEVVLCGPLGRYHVTLLDRNQSPANQLFKKIRRGDMVKIKVPASSSSPSPPERGRGLGRGGGDVAFDVDGRWEMGRNDRIEILG